MPTIESLERLPDGSVRCVVVEHHKIILPTRKIREGGKGKVRAQKVLAALRKAVRGK